MTKFIITDEAGTSGTVTVADRAEVVGAIRGWFPDAPPEVREALDELDDRLVRREYTGDLEAFLGITVREV